MLQVDFLFAVSTTDLVDHSSLLVGAQVWSLISIMWLSLSLTLHESPVDQRQDEIRHFC